MIGPLNREGHRIGQLVLGGNVWRAHNWSARRRSTKSLVISMFLRHRIWLDRRSPAFQLVLELTRVYGSLNDKEGRPKIVGQAPIAANLKPQPARAAAAVQRRATDGDGESHTRHPTPRR